MGEHLDNFKKKGDESLQKKIVFFVVDNFVPKSRSIIKGTEKIV